MTIKKIYSNEDDCKYKGDVVGFWDSKSEELYVVVGYSSGKYSPETFIKTRMEKHGSEDSILNAVARQVPKIRVLFKDLKKTFVCKFKKGQQVSYHGYHSYAVPEIRTLTKFNGWKLNCRTSGEKDVLEMWTLKDTNGHEAESNSSQFSELGDFDKWYEGKKIALEAKRKLKAAGCRGFKVIYEGKTYTVN